MPFSDASGLRVSCARMADIWQVGEVPGLLDGAHAGLAPERPPHQHQRQGDQGQRGGDADRQRPGRDRVEVIDLGGIDLEQQLAGARRRVVASLGHGPASVSELAQGAGMTLPSFVIVPFPVPLNCPPALCRCRSG